MPSFFPSKCPVAFAWLSLARICLVVSILIAVADRSQAQATATLTTLHNFSATDSNGDNSDGFEPQAGVTQGSDGNFYGTANFGGANGFGTIFRVTPTGDFTVLHTFGLFNGTIQNLDGGEPEGVLTQGQDGNFYGTTHTGGIVDYGTVFQLTPDGVFITLHGFGDSDISGGNPGSGLIEVAPGSFYGTTTDAGPNGGGTFFQITTDGDLDTLASFYQILVSTPANPDGVPADPRPQYIIDNPYGGFYGTTYRGGTNTTGSIFEFSPPGTLTTLYSFDAVPDEYGGDYTNDNGAYPVGNLIQDSGGNMYGVTSNGGAAGVGSLIQGTDGSFYGTTPAAGTSIAPGSISGGSGTVFKLTVSPAITSATTAGGQIGSAFSYQITGTFNPTSYGATGLPDGLSFDASTGLISGIPTDAGDFSVTLSAANAGGPSTAVLTLTVVSSPGVTAAAGHHQRLDRERADRPTVRLPEEATRSTASITFN